VPRDDRELVAACLAGDQQACTGLVETYVRMVGTVIWRATGQRDVIEDLTQETFLRTFRALEYFDSRARLSTWIYTIAHNVAIDYLRRTAGAKVDSLTWRAVKTTMNRSARLRQPRWIRKRSCRASSQNGSCMTGWHCCR
jgi:RNA polymerase sigma factor (sigma-70 family)